jgi:hypothetical protein
MVRNVVSAAVVLGFCLGVSLGDEVKGKIIKIDDKSVTIMYKDKDKDKAEEKTLDMGKNVKFMLVVDKDKKEPLEGGLDSKYFKNLKPKKGLNAVLTVKDKEVTQIDITKPINQVKGKITKISGDSVTVMVKKKNDTVEKKYTMAKECKVCKFEEDKKVALDGGLKASVFKDIDAEKGVAATLILNDQDQVTEVIVGTAKKK